MSDALILLYSSVSRSCYASNIKILGPIDESIIYGQPPIAEITMIIACIVSPKIFVDDVNLTSHIDVNSELSRGAAD